MSTLIQCQNVTKRYGNTVALDNVNFAVESGHIVGLLGPNGSGKTTLIKLLNGLLVQEEGQILVGGNPVGIQSKAMISYLPDINYLDMSKTVENIAKTFALFYPDFDMNRAYDMFNRLRIDTKKPLKHLSKGTKEKVQLVLVMSRRAQLYILDEPIAGVDPAARDFILKVILDNYDSNATILISTHLIADIENILDQVIFINDSHIVGQMTVDDIRANNGMSVDAYFRKNFRFADPALRAFMEDGKGEN